MQKSISEIYEVIRKNALRLTKGKKVVVEALHRARKPMTAQDVYEKIISQTAKHGSEGADLATVYRTLEALVKIGVAERVEHSERGWQYVMSGRAHSHNIHCVSCGKDVAMSECMLHEIEKRVAQITGFSAVRHVVNFYGECPQCHTNA